MKKVMVRAWEIAKEGQKKFGGNVKEYLRVALKMAWAETKSEEKISEQIILVADHDNKVYSVSGEKNGKVFWKKEGIASSDRDNYLGAYNYLTKGKGIKTVSFYVIKNGEKKFVETKAVA